MKTIKLVILIFIGLFVLIPISFAATTNDIENVPSAGKELNLLSTPDLKFAGELQNCSIYTPDGTIGHCSTFFMLARSISEIGVVDKADFAYKRLLKIETIKDLKIESQDDVEINGLSGREIIAKAVTKKYHTPIMIYTIVLFGSKTYYIMQGQTPLTEVNKYEPIFKSMARSFRSK